MTATLQKELHDPLQRPIIFETLYREAFPIVARLISKQSGSLQDAKDVFQDALVILYEKTVQLESTAIDHPHSYLIGIAKHLWIRKTKNNQLLLSLDDLEKQIELPEDYLEDTSHNHLLTLLERSGRKCLELLSAFYYDHLSIEAISSQFGFSGAHSASAQKYKCIEKLRHEVKKKALHHEDFI